MIVGAHQAGRRPGLVGIDAYATLAFVPSDIASLKTWLAAGEGFFTDTTRTTPATAQDAQIAAWADKSGLGNHVTQATGGNRPTLDLIGGLNGYPASKFTRASSQYLSGPTLNLAQPNTMFIVAKVIGGSGGSNTLIGSVAAGQHDMYIVSAGNFRIYDGATEQASAGTYVDDWHTFGHQAKADPDLGFVDGVQVISGASGSDALNSVRIGANLTPGNYLGGWVLEVLVYNVALTAPQMAQVTAYLDNKFGISGVAPLGMSFPFGVFEDLNVQNPTTFATMLTDIATFGMDSVMLTNGNVVDGEALAAVADARAVPITVGPVAELNADNGASLGPLIRKFRRHRSIAAYAPLRDEPPASDASVIAGWVTAITAIDTRRPASVVLAGTDRVQPIYDAALPGWQLIDAYPCQAGFSEMDFSHIFGYAALDLETYTRLVTQSKAPTTPLIMVLQTHGSVAFGLRVPTPREVRRQFWEAVALGANGIYWFIYKTQQDWQGLDLATTLRAELLSIATNDLTAGIRAALARTVRCLDEWSASNGATCRTISNVDASGHALGNARYPVVFNRTTSPITTTLTALAGPARSTTRMKDGVVTGTATIQPGNGVIFQTTPQAQATGVPDVPIDWTLTPTQRRAAHPFNDPAYEVALHPLGGTVTVGMTKDQIQAVYDGLPLGPARVEWQAGTYTIPTTNPLRLYGRSNLHHVAVGGTVTLVPGGSVPAAPTTDYQAPMILIGPGMQTIEPATAYADFNAGVDIGSNSPIPWLTYFRNPVTDMYWDGFTFNGGARLARPVTATSLRRVAFRRCRWTNLRDSFEASAGSDGFHWGSFTGNTRMEQISFLDCIFDGPGRWVIYLDGPHGGCIARNTIAGSQYGSGGFVMLTNDDFSYSDTIAAHVATTNDEKRSAMYQLFWANTFTGSLFQVLSYSGGNLLFADNEINSCTWPVGVTPRGSNKWGPLAGLVLYHYGNEITGNHVGTITGDGSLGFVNAGLTHCGVSNTPASYWDPASGGSRAGWGRMGTGIDPLVPGVLKSMRIEDNRVDSGPGGLVLLNRDNVVGEPGPAGTLEGPVLTSGNTKGGSPLT